MKKKYRINSRRKTISPIRIALLFILFIIMLAIGYATMSDTLTINGIANIGSFSITYNLNGGTNVANPITQYYATTNGVLPIPSYSGYTFGGWYENDTFTGTPLTTTPTRQQCKRSCIVCKMGNK